MTNGERRPPTSRANHARVLIVISKSPEIRLCDLAGTIGITERFGLRVAVSNSTHRRQIYKEREPSVRGRSRNAAIQEHPIRPR